MISYVNFILCNFEKKKQINDFYCTFVSDYKMFNIQINKKYRYSNIFSFKTI